MWIEVLRAGRNNGTMEVDIRAPVVGSTGEEANGLGDWGSKQYGSGRGNPFRGLSLLGQKKMSLS